MRKLQHINSWTVGSEEDSTNSRQEEGELRTSDAPARQKEIKALEGKILLLEEKTKGIQQFYEAKIAHLKTVLAKQNDNKLELTQELIRLSHESQKQTRSLHHLKAKLLEDKFNPTPQPPRRHLFNLNPTEPSPEHHPLRSKSKPKFLFCNNHLSSGGAGSANLSSGSSKSGKLLLKKCRSEEYVDSEYFNQVPMKPDRSAPGVRNPEHVRRGYR